ncbi:MAG: ATP-binding protein [Elusimicrobia bacterium]|nr:ATP-binding protein [Elusimicrobiota bacterium]
MITRKIDFAEIKQRLSQFRVTALIGPRQTGKTTLAKQFKADAYFDLENPRDVARLENPQLTLEKIKSLIVIDEVQRKPELFPLIRYLVDTIPEQRYLILGSASPEIIKNSSETLAGRIAFYTLEGFRQSDIARSGALKLWLRGGLPLSFLASNDSGSFQWREEYVRTFLERDIPNLGIRVPANTLRRFWQMVSHYHGNVVNMSELGRSFGVADTTVMHYLEILKGTFMVRLLQPWYVNIGKRVVKRPKVYLRDSGLFHTLLSLETGKALFTHPKLGSSWEGFALDCVWRSVNKPDDNAYFWATHAGAEVDLFWQHDGENWACEFKYTDAPKLTKSMAVALEDLKLKKLWIVYPGDKRYFVHERVEVIPLAGTPDYWDYRK